jgi:hypothetical protein
LVYLWRSIDAADNATVGTCEHADTLTYTDSIKNFAHFSSCLDAVGAFDHSRRDRTHGNQIWNDGQILSKRSCSASQTNGPFESGIPEKSSGNPT